LQRKHYAIYGDPRPFLLRGVCNEIIELDNGKLYSYKGNYYYLEKEERIASENSRRKTICKRIRMDATSTESENNKIKIASGRFYEIKDKAQNRKENKVELEINMERMGSKIIEHKISRNLRTMSSWIISVTTFNRRTHWNHREKWNGKSTF
jgi:ATP-binding cassette subfamily F protein uup